MGEKLKNETLELIMNIYRANGAAEKRSHLSRAREHTEVVRLLLRLTKDMNQIDLKRFVIINEKLENVSRQLTGWQRSSKT